VAFEPSDTSLCVFFHLQEAEGGPECSPIFKTA
jgi:hypothetical protein